MRWFNVHDMLPEDDSFVLMYSDDDIGIEVGLYSSLVFNYYGWGGHGEGDMWQEREEVTHWAQLPEPPTED